MKSFVKYFFRLLIYFIPETRFFELKSLIYRIQGYDIGRNTRICSSARIYGSGKIKIGNNVWIGSEVMIISSSKITIEDDVDIAPRVYIGTGTHIIGDIIGRIAGTPISKDILIKKGSWIGSNAIIQPGVTVETMNIVNSGAVVTKKFKPYSVLAGMPARIVKIIDFEKNRI